MARSLPKGFGQLSGKHVQVDKANTVVIISAVLVAIIVVFCIFAAKSLVGLISYQNSVIDLRKEANNQLVSNYDATQQLLLAYSAFDSAPESIIGTSDNNSKIILDSLPSKYDFPALATTVEGMINGAGCKVASLGGIDDELMAVKSSTNPVVVPIEVAFDAKCDYASSQKLINDFYRSIRPFEFKSIGITASGGAVTISAIAETAYQPSKELGINEVVVNESGEFATQETASTPTEVQN